MILPADIKYMEVDLDREEALEEFGKYEDHSLQPKGYNVFFHNPPLNPENRVLVSEGGKRIKVLVESHMKPLTWNYEDLGKVWDWAITDVWAWVRTDDSMFHLTLTTVKHELDKIYRVRDYFTSNLENNNNIYVGELSKYLETDKNYKDKYKEELTKLNERVEQLGVGFIKRDPEDDYLITVCLPEENLSNDVLEKWYSLFVDFAKSKLECINFSQGEIV